MKYIKFEGCLDCPYRDEYNGSVKKPNIDCKHPDRANFAWENVIEIDDMPKDFKAPSWCPVKDIN